MRAEVEERNRQNWHDGSSLRMALEVMVLVMVEASGECLRALDLMLHLGNVVT